MALSIWGRGALKLLCSLLGLIVGIVGAFSFGLFGPAQLATIADAAWIAMPRPAIFQLEFDFRLVPAFLAAGIAAALRTVGVITTCHRINDVSWRRPDMSNIRKGVLADGLPTLVEAVSA